LRRLFAFSQVNECNGDVTPTIHQARFMKKRIARTTAARITTISTMFAKDTESLTLPKDMLSGITYIGLE
jgi:hypothetical protein